MHLLLDEFEEAAEQLAHQAHDGTSYLDKYSADNDVFLEITRERQEIDTMRQKVHAQKVLSKLRKKANSFIHDHPSYPTLRLHQMQTLGDYDFNQEEGDPAGLLQVNQGIQIMVSIRELYPLLCEWANLANELSFDCLRFQLHHGGKTAVSKFMRFDPQYNLHHCSQLVRGRLVAARRCCTLRIQHEVRQHNILLYQELFRLQRPLLVAESVYGAVLGFAQIDIGMKQAETLANGRLLCLQFSQAKPMSSQLSNRIIFSAKGEVCIKVSPISPELDSLRLLPTQQSSSPSKSRSISPGRILSRSPNRQRSKSNKQKRKLLAGIVGGSKSVVVMNVLEGRESKLQVRGIELTTSKQLVYRKATNIGERKIELVRAGSRFYLKILLCRENSAKSANIMFAFNNQQYSVNVLANSLLQILELSQYQQRVQQKERSDRGRSFRPNTLVHLGSGQFVFCGEKRRLVKGLALQELEEGLLSSLFIPTKFLGAQIYCSKPFCIFQIVQKTEGYLITFYYQGQPVLSARQSTVIFYLTDSSFSEIHVFDCLVKRRTAGRDTLSTQLEVSVDQQFLRVNMKTITDEGQVYQIKAFERDYLTVVNGVDFKYRSISNQWLQLQLLKPIQGWLQSDLLFYGSKGKSFYVHLTLIPS